MNERTYISRLEYCLSSLDEHERQEVLDDYRRHFRDGRMAGESDEQIIARLGIPEGVAAEYFEQNGAGFEPRPRTPRWVKLLVGGSAAFWLACVVIAGMSYARVHHANTYVPRPMGVSIEVAATTMMSADHNGMYDMSLSEMMELAGETFSAFPSIPDIPNLERYAEADWSYWTSGPLAQMEEVYFCGEYGDITEIAVKGEYDMSVSFLEDTLTDTVAVTIEGNRPVQHDIKVEAHDGKLTIEYVSGGINVNLPGDRALHVQVALPGGWRGSAEVFTMSGSVFQETWLGFEAFDVSTVSGAIRLDGNNGVVRAATLSGSVQIYGGADSLSVAAIVGDVVLQLAREPREMNVSTVSGNIDLIMDGRYSFTHSSVSGALFNSGGGVEQQGAPYSFSTVSGEVRLCEW